MKKMFLALALFNAGCLVGNDNAQEGPSLENKSPLFDCVGRIATTTFVGGALGGATGGALGYSTIMTRIEPRPKSLHWVSQNTLNSFRKVPTSAFVAIYGTIGLTSFAAASFVGAFGHEFLNAGWKNRY